LCFALSWLIVIFARKLSIYADRTTPKILLETEGAKQLPRGEIRTVHHVGERICSFVVDDYRLIKAELVGGGII
jgi:hypothetical protein